MLQLCLVLRNGSLRPEFIWHRIMHPYKCKRCILIAICRRDRANPSIRPNFGLISDSKSKLTFAWQVITVRAIMLLVLKQRSDSGRHRTAALRRYRTAPYGAVRNPTAVNLPHLAVLIEHDSISAALPCGTARRRPQCGCPD
jgi:hypothetical protein